MYEIILTISIILGLVWIIVGICTSKCTAKEKHEYHNNNKQYGMLRGPELFVAGLTKRLNGPMERTSRGLKPGAVYSIKEYYDNQL